MKAFLRKWGYILSLSIVVLILIVANYSPGTFLTGWDTLHPEFNFKENFLRLIFGVWRPEQGLGAVAGHSHMADLPRVLLLWFWSIFLPLSFLRYAYVFFCLFLGPLGIYFLVDSLLKKENFRQPAAFLSALVYLMNLSTLQQFYVPFEMFPTQWAYLPWLIFFSLRYLETAKKNTLLLYALATFFATPQAYAAHLWYPFFGLYTLFILLIFWFKKGKARQPLILILVTLLVNLFWLLPNIYFVLNKGYVARENLNNKLYSQEFLAQNRATGNLADSMLIKGFYFNWEIYNFDTKASEELLAKWNDHLKNADVTVVGYALFASAIIGLFLAVRYKQKTILSLSPFFILSFVFIANRTFPFSLLFDALLKIPVFEEALRFSFTKISIAALFGQTLLVAFFLAKFFNFIKSQRARIFFGAIFVLGLIIYFAPAFKGDLVSSKVRRPIPESYFNLWNYLQSAKKARVLTLPLNNPSGWVYYDWGYQGSGLIWFGNPQPVMDRDFDRWSEFNEQSYREFYNSLYTQNYPLFDQALSKYRIGYILRDFSQNPTVLKNQKQITLRRETNDFFRELQLRGRIKAVKQFGSLILYELKNPSSLVEIGQIGREVNPSYKWQILDWQYQSRDYFSDKETNYNYYLARNSFVEQNRLDPKQVLFYQANGEQYLKWQGSQIVLKNQLVLSPVNLASYSMSELIRLSENKDSLIFENGESTLGIQVPIPRSDNLSGYLVAVESKYHSGFPLRLCFKNYYTSTCQINDQLSRNTDFAWDYFLIPTSAQASEYALELHSIYREKINNLSEVRKILVIPVPIDKAAVVVSNARVDEPSWLSEPLAWSSSGNGSRFNLQVNPGDKHVVLWQAFDSGWRAYLNGRKLKNHILINNWANGWEIPEGICGNSQCQMTIIFWPQYLEFVGFGFLGLVFIWLLI